VTYDHYMNDQQLVEQQGATVAKLHVCNRDGPKFSRRRSSAQKFSQMFGLATCDYSAEVQRNFGVICGFAFVAFCTGRWR